MKLSKITLFFALFLCLSAFISHDDWHFEKEEEGVKVYLKNMDGSDVPAFKAESILSGNMDEIESILLDFNNVQKWMSSCSHSELLEFPTDSSAIFYTQFKAPWPVSDRDNISQATVHQLSEESIKIDIVTLPSYIPEKRNYVRIPYSQGSWQLNRLSEEETEVIYIMHSERGGNIPSFLSNQLLLQAPVETIKKLQGCLSN